MFSPSSGLLNVLPSKATVFKALAFVAYFVGSVRVVTMINGAKSIDVADIWPEVAKDLTRVSWAHAVNSEQELKTALRGKNLGQNVTLGCDFTIPSVCRSSRNDD